MCSYECGGPGESLGGLRMCLRSYSRDCAGETPGVELRMRPTCYQVLRVTVIKTMSTMWINLLCVRVLFPMGSREFLCPNMGICDVNKSHGLNTRF